MSAFIVNPRPLPHLSEISALTRAWLDHESFVSGRLDVFEGKWSGLSDAGRLVLAALIDEGGTAVLKHSVKRTLRDRYGVPLNEDDHLVRNGVQQLTNVDLVKTRLTDSGEELSLHPSWATAVRPRVHRWIRERGSQAV